MEASIPFPVAGGLVLGVFIVGLIIVVIGAIDWWRNRK